MKIHEYQAKEILRQANVPVPPGSVAERPDQVAGIVERLGLPVVVKAQVLVGGRGKAGGVRSAATLEEARAHAEAILSMTIKGLPVAKVLVERAVRAQSEAYLGVIIDRARRRPVVIASREGGVEIEEVAARAPQKIFRLWVDPLAGLRDYQARALGTALYDDPPQAKAASGIVRALYQLFLALDASLVEINPLVSLGDGSLLALDAKINLDDNALFRQEQLASLRDLSAEDPLEVEARQCGLSFVRMNGEIGCIVNGAGLAMATMDLVKRFGAEPANFLDVGGSSSPEKVLNAMRLLLAQGTVKVVLINIFGGITRCDDVARGIAFALDKLAVKVPLVVRLTGTNEAEARRILASLGIEACETMEAAVRRAVELAKAGAAG